MTAGAPTHDGQMAPASIWRRLPALASLSAVLFIYAVNQPAQAQSSEFRTPAISVVQPDWPAAAIQLKAEIDSQPAASDSFSFMGPRPRSRQAGATRINAISQINAVTSPIFPGIELSPVPVLLPFDSAL